MRLENFKIIDSIAIEYGGYYLDLHNNFNFVGLVYDVPRQRIELEWNKNLGEWSRNERYEKIKLTFDAVSVFCVRARDQAKPFSEDECLSYIGYLHPDDMDVMDGFLPVGQSSDDYHVILGFEGGLVIKLYSRIARVEVLC
ncbi:hypothetical protein [Pseudomonas indica]|uniref:hypothetical protein n=1 Tax=Pseudomonas indica TaxID=137658 RepID=UPI001140E96E|nr:hypothetical protein [Pseudomonas indica]MBU3057894.1 hypothetical protein [Pseudomonas indica]